MNDKNDIAAQPTDVPLTPEIMSALGFRGFWPQGNPTEHWWRSEAAGDVVFTTKTI